MKKYILTGALLFSALSLFTQQIPPGLAGKWLGVLDVGVELRIVFQIEIADDSLHATLDSPDQGVYGIATSSASYKNGELSIAIPMIGANFNGSYENDSMRIKGTFTQGVALPVTLNKVDSVEPVKRSQTPVQPYPYKEEHVQFINKNTDSVSLGGTLTIPPGEGPFPAVILVSGSGPQDRDESLLGHSPFLILSDYLTRQNILVLRYDDRGVGKSTGDFFSATSLEFADDASAAVDFLYSRKNELNISKIGIAGHSEGGLIAPITASKNEHVDFIVLMAGPGIPGDSILQLQGDLIARSAGMSDSIISVNNYIQKQMIKIVKEENDYRVMEERIIAFNKQFLAETPTATLEQLGLTATDTLEGVDFFVNPWAKFFLTYDPGPTLEKTKIPVLALNGTKDLQVPYLENLSAIDAALKQANNKNYRIEEMEGLNHLFQKCNQCTLNEYSQLEETWNEEAMKIIASWVLER